MKAPTGRKSRCSSQLALCFFQCSQELRRGSFALLRQAVGQELMLTAPLTRAALLKLTGRPSITKWRMQPVKGLLGAKRGVSRDSEKKKETKNQDCKWGIPSPNITWAEIYIVTAHIIKMISMSKMEYNYNWLLFSGTLPAFEEIWTCGNFKVLPCFPWSNFWVDFICLPGLKSTTYI